MADDGTRGADGPFRLGRRAVGLLLLLLVLVPIYRVLPGLGAGFAARQAERTGDGLYTAMWIGSAALLLAGGLLAALLAGDRATRLLRRAGDRLLRPSPGAFAAGAGALSALLTALFSLGVLGGRPVLNDAVVQLLQGRYVAAGRLAGPPLELAEFRNVQFMLDLPVGWVSQYPPLHTLVLGAGLALGVVWLTGPLLMGATTLFTCRAAERLLPGRPRTARLGGLLVAVSPFLVGLAGSYTSHATAAALAALTAWAAAESVTAGPPETRPPEARPPEERGFMGAARPGWAAVAGAAAAALVATRPLSGLVIGGALLTGTWVWLGAWGREAGGSRREGSGSGPRTRRKRAARLLLPAAAAALPILVLFCLYNAHFFGSPFRLGYSAAAGPAHGLGFHVDPWGDPYGPVQALGYVSADLLALSRHLLGTPIPSVGLVGLWLLLRRRLAGAERALLAWALLPVAAQALYWHHDLVLGPRLLGEAGPAWAILTGLAAVDLTRRLPGGAGDGPARAGDVRAGAGDPSAGDEAAPGDREAGAAGPRARSVGGFGRPGRPSPRAVLGVTLALALAIGVAWLGPRRLLDIGQRVPGVVRDPPRPAGPALVFVHEPWTDRLGARLSARGFRLDEVRRFLREGDRCLIQAWLDRDAPSPESMGDLSAAERRTAVERCRAEAAADRPGTLGLPALLWQGDLPGLAGDGPPRAMWVRDLGPRLNRPILERHRERAPLVLVPSSGGWRLQGYEEGMRRYWGAGAP